MENNEKKSNVTLILCAVIAILLLLFWFKGCGSAAPVYKKVKTPEVTGSVQVVNPVNNPVVNTKNGRTKIANAGNDEFLQSEIDRLLAEYNALDIAFAKANDSLQQEIYKRTIAPKLFSHHFDNDTLSATVKGIVANGEVEKLKLDYTIKSRNLDVKVPQVKFRLLGGVEAGMTKDLSRFNAKANIGIQNKKGNILTVSADTDQRFYVGYTMSIFSIKR